MKILVLGFDGASPKLIDQWLNDLPTFKTFKSEGVFGQTIPPLPAQTPVAWTTFMTGKKPSNHGIFSFVMRKKGTYERIIAEPGLVKSKNLFQILSENGKRVCALNVPMCGNNKIRGCVVPGFLARNEGMFYPHEVREQIRRKFKLGKLRGDIRTKTLQGVKSDPDLFFEEVNDVTDELADVSLYLLQNQTWDLFMSVFMGTDRIQHFFWNTVDESHSKYERNRYSNFVKNFYVKIDRITRNFLNSVDEDTVTFVISDHGFCPIEKEVVVNNYLAEPELVKIKNGKVDVENSKAICYGYGDIWLNVKGREPCGIVEPGEQYEELRKKIIDQLMSITIDSKSPLKYVSRSEDIYGLKCLSDGPDLYAVFKTGWQAARNPEIMEQRSNGRYVKDEPMWSGGHDGTHDPSDVPGILCASNSRVRRVTDLVLPLQDIAPSILNLMDVSAPQDLDGKSYPLIV